jgi:hypothetical protein
LGVECCVLRDGWGVQDGEGASWHYDRAPGGEAERTTPDRALERHFHAGARSGVVRSGGRVGMRLDEASFAKKGSGKRGATLTLTESPHRVYFSVLRTGLTLKVIELEYSHT